MPKLTDTFCRKTCNPGKHWDTEIRGFGLFVGKHARTFYYQRDVAGRTRRVRIGP